MIQPLWKIKNLNVLLVFIFLSSFYIDWHLNWNTVSRVAMPLSIVLENKLEIDSYAEFTGDKAKIGEHYYSDKGPLQGFLMVPVLYVANKICSFEDLSAKKQLEIGLILGALIFGSLPFALVLWTLYNTKWKRSKYGIQIVMLVFFGSFLFVFSGTFFSHAFAGALVLFSFLTFERKNYFLSGILIGAAFMTEYSLAIVGFGCGIYLIMHSKFFRLGQYILGILPFIAFQAIYNAIVTGNFYDFAYKYQENFAMNSVAYGFTYPNLKALFHITISPYRGIFFYTPVLLGMIYLSIKTKRKELGFRRLYGFFIVISLVYIFIFSMSKSWYGGWTFGQRYLYPVPIILFYVFSAKEYMNKKRIWIFYALGFVGLIQAFLAKATVMFPPTDKYFPLVDVFIPHALKNQWNESNILSSLNLSGKLDFIVFTSIFFLCVWLLSYVQNKKINKSM